MNSIFIDTSFLIAVLRTRDQYHGAAMNWKRMAKGPYVSTEYVLIEFADACTPVALRRRAVQAIRILREETSLTIVPASTVLMEEGLDLFDRHADKEWGLTDCISFTIMRRYGIVDALTSDRHFEQAGFRAMLRLKAGT